MIGMDVQQGFDRRRQRKVRVKVRTNRGLDFLTAVRPDATISDLANRALSVYMQISGDGHSVGTKKQLTVSAVKQGIFYMPKSELVASLLNHDDEVEVVIIKAKPKYPNQLYQNQQGQQNVPRVSVGKMDLQPVVEIFQEKEEIEEKDVVVGGGSEREADRVSTISKRQRKKEKKQQKQRIKQMVKQKQLDTLKPAEKQAKQSTLQYKPQTKHEPLLSETKLTKEIQQLQQSNPRKRLKFDKQQVSVLQKPLPPLVIPSPKITFHNQPRLQSPKFTLLSESSKKKWEGQMRKQSEEADKRSQLQKIISPVMASRSPLIYQRSPIMSLSDNKPRDKDELANFSLTYRKLSEDKKLEAKKEKDREKEVQMPSPRKEDLKSSLKKDEEKQLPPIEPEKLADKLEEKKEPDKRDVPAQKKVEPPLKTKHTSLIVVQQDDSDSQENKKSNGHYQHHRQKELTEIQQKISEFLIESDEE